MVNPALKLTDNKSFKNLNAEIFYFFLITLNNKNLNFLSISVPSLSLHASFKKKIYSDKFKIPNCFFLMKAYQWNIVYILCIIKHVL